MQRLESIYNNTHSDRLIKFRNIDGFQRYKRSVADKRVLVERLIASDNKNKEKWHLIGFCEACRRESRFMVDWQYSNGVEPNYRERLVCEHCGLNNRQRFIAALLKRLLRTGGKPITQICVSEQVTNFYKYIKENIKNADVVGGDYLGKLDIIVSNDEYEHVPDIQTVLKEAYRVLKTNGKLLLTIPFHYSEAKTKQRAFVDNGKIVHLLPAQYHGNPLSEKGSLVFYEYGWDFLDLCKRAGFNDAYVLGYYSFLFGYIGEGLQMIIMAEKNTG
jgi:methyltransferase family protein